MLNFTTYTVDQIKDAFGILTGQRYEFIIDVEVEEDDELYTENGLYIRCLYLVDEEKTGLLKYELIEKVTNSYIDLELEDDELQAVENFCKEHVQDETVK
ncbi:MULTISPECIES: DUF6509 family protein [Paenibacillus]|jgi:hypothetical protein|uniref:DUF6509 family protein n=2 Tax=Paenibacillus TaxID=44249 RepID=A0AAJ3MEM0_PAEPO|nr:MULTISPECIES: DUF6509 family protein [Paenibacillus]AHC19804.1 pullulanase [Paenibacillus polymyxa CR1]APB76215.1 pullulanase [Paenibacillus polymyxa]APQ59246.1 pullulanase [Paenibacillus polymyxa]MCP3745255.1 DUF6509 family protein [Paenibacillus sp. A3M_27_13]MDH2329306.1 DUF6509 family protein [Paenibacillus polymyxa]